MKNKVITIICILAIVMTASIVAFAGGGTTAYFNDDSKVTSPYLIDQNVIEESNEYLVPGETLTRSVMVKTGTDNKAVLFRTVFAFEGENMTLSEFKDKFSISFTHDNNWTLSSNWEQVTYGGENYFVKSAVYNKPLEVNDQATINYAVTMDSGVKSELVAALEDGDGYEVIVTSQAVQKDGWKTGTDAPVTLFDYNVIKDIFNIVFGEASVNLGGQ